MQELYGYSVSAVYFTAILCIDEMRATVLLFFEFYKVTFSLSLGQVSSQYLGVRYVARPQALACLAFT